MKEEILSNLDNPAQLERLYRADKSAFKHAFQALYPQLQNSSLTSFWNTRLNFGREDISWGTRKELLLLLIASMVAGLVAKLPAIFHIDEDFFYSRNAGFIIFPVIAAYFAWKNKLSAGKTAFIVGSFLLNLAFINLLPDAANSDTLKLACIHLPLLLWSITGFAFVGEQGDLAKRLRFLKYNGDLVVMTTLILIAGAILTGITIGLFSLIGLEIERFYFDYIVIFGLPAAPILGTYLIQTNPQVVSRVSPVIAKLFSPLVLVMLLAYLIAIVYSGKDPFNDREFLLVFNALLVGVMAIIFFSVAETSGTAKTSAEIWVLLLLSVVTILVNGIALSAILFRISAWGITPNRLAVLGGNIIILVNLLIVAVQLYRVVSKKTGLADIGKAISFYLPVYCLWAFLVSFLFPLLFAFK